MANEDSTTKRCTKCGQVFPATPEYFFRASKNKDGLNFWCKRCLNAATRQWERNNPDKVSATKKKTRAKFADKIREYNQKYYQENREVILKRSAEWRKANLAHLLVMNTKRRSKRYNLPRDFTADQWQECLEYWGGKCCICGREHDFWHIIVREHWIAVNDKRPNNPGTVAWNMLPMCHSAKGSPKDDPGCNQSKWQHDPIEWLERKLGKRKAAKKLAEIEAYFGWVKSR
jgi:hypothetical protein